MPIPLCTNNQISLLNYLFSTQRTNQPNLNCEQFAQRKVKLTGSVWSHFTPATSRYFCHIISSTFTSLNTQNTSKYSPSHICIVLNASLLPYKISISFRPSHLSQIIHLQLKSDQSCIKNELPTSPHHIATSHLTVITTNTNYFDKNKLLPLNAIHICLFFIYISNAFSSLVFSLC